MRYFVPAMVAFWSEIRVPREAELGMEKGEPLEYIIPPREEYHCRAISGDALPDKPAVALDAGSEPVSNRDAAVGAAIR